MNPATTSLRQPLRAMASSIRPASSSSLQAIVRARPGSRFYTHSSISSALPCTNSLRRTLYASRPLVNTTPAAAPLRRPLATQLTPVVRRGFASEASKAATSSTISATSTASAPAKKSEGFMDKIKALIKKYGYTGVAVYLGISFLDLAATFVIVKAAGMEKIERAQDWVIDQVGPYIGVKTKPHHQTHSHPGETPKDEDPAAALDKVDDQQVGAIYNKASGLWSVFVIAYGIHKLLVPFRVVATGAITPPLVKWLVKRGWIKGVAKSAPKAAAATSTTVAAGASVSNP